MRKAWPGIGRLEEQTLAGVRICSYNYHNMKQILFLTCLFVMVWVVTSPFRAIHHGPGALASGDPVQSKSATGVPIRLEGWTLEPLATYSVQARVLGVKKYGSDFTAEIAPYDLLLGWGPMSDSANLDHMTFRQSGRFGFWQTASEPPIPQREIDRHIANTHLIPANAGVRKRIDGLRVGSIIHLRGKLVEARPAGGGPPWRSSLTRNDRGDGACEILYVESLIGG